jgi:Predicted flavin-nucleotide-binding protein
MRRKEYEVTDPEALRAILDECKVCRVAVRDDEGPYIVPMNFGYKLYGKSLTLYFHSAKQGRKVDAFAKDGRVAFELDCAHSLIAGDKACAYSFAYKSIIGDGKIRTVDDAEEKKEALSVLMRHQTGKDFTFTDEMTRPVLVFKLEADRFTGKQINE